MTLTVEQAGQDDEPAIRALQADAVAWLASIGSDQWQPSSPSKPDQQGERGLTSSISRSEVYLVRNNGAVIGTFTLDNYADPEFWTEQDHPSAGLYLHRMIVRRDFAGQGIGELIVNWCSKEADRRGKEWIRLDAWVTNQKLHKFYASLGFNLVRTVDLPHRGSGKLFQRAVSTKSERMPRAPGIHTGHKGPSNS